MVMICPTQLHFLSFLSLIYHTLANCYIRVSISSQAQDNNHNVRLRIFSPSARWHDRYPQVNRRINITRPITALPPRRSLNNNSNISILFCARGCSRNRAEQLSTSDLVCFTLCTILSDVQASKMLITAIAAMET